MGLSQNPSEQKPSQAVADRKEHENHDRDHDRDHAQHAQVVGHPIVAIERARPAERSPESR